MTELTAAKIELVLLALEERQLREVPGTPAPGRVGPAYLARLSQEIGVPLSRATFERQEQIALRTARLAIEALAAADLSDPQS